MENNNKEMKDKAKDFFGSKKFLMALKILGIFVIAILIFHTGEEVGFHKAGFGRDWDEHYLENFGMMGHRGLPVNTNGQFPNEYGAVGKIIKVQLPSLIVAGNDGTEKVIELTDDTNIRQGRDEANISDLKIDSYVTVIGSPNSSGQIVAKFIRIMPTPLVPAAPDQAPAPSPTQVQ